MDILLFDLTVYDTRVKESLKQLIRKNKKVPPEEETHIYAGRTDHQTTLEKLLEAIEFVVLRSGWEVTLKTKNINTLWKTFVESPNFSQDQALFLQFINKKRYRPSKYDSSGHDKGGIEVHLFTAEEQKHLFTQILCNEAVVDYRKLSSNLYKCF